MNNIEKIRPFTVGVVINSALLVILVTGFCIGYLLDLGIFRKMTTVFVVVMFILAASIVLYTVIDHIQCRKEKGVKNEKLVE